MSNGDEKKKEVYERYRFRIQNENELIHHRMSWFIPLQSFLFISLAIFSNGKLTESLGEIFIIGVAVVGSISGIATLLSVGSAVSTARTLEAIWDTEFQDTDGTKEFPPLMGGLRGDERNIYQRARILGLNWPDRRITGTATTFGLPTVVVIFWVVVAVAVPKLV